MSGLARKLKDIAMERSRDISGYKTFIGIDVEALAREAISDKGFFRWYDLCCGHFVAGQELYEILEEDCLHDKIAATGIDIDLPVEGPILIYPNVQIVEYDASDYSVDTADLVTCTQGLRYIQQFLRRGPQAVQNWYNSMPHDSLLAFDIPLDVMNFGGFNILEELQEQLGDAVDHDTIMDKDGRIDYRIRIRKNGASLYLPHH
jgi:hypothetical protein